MNKEEFLKHKRFELLYFKRRWGETGPSMSDKKIIKEIDNHKISAVEYRKLHGLVPAGGPKKKKNIVSQRVGELEKDIQARILDRLGYLKNGFFWRENSGLIQQEYKGKKRVWRSGLKGISDIMGVYKGVGVAIEVKRPGREPTPYQIAFQERYKQAGGIAFVCDDDEKVVEQLEDAEIDASIKASGLKLGC